MLCNEVRSRLVAGGELDLLFIIFTLSEKVEKFEQLLVLRCFAQIATSKPVEIRVRSKTPKSFKMHKVEWQLLTWRNKEQQSLGLFVSWFLFGADDKYVAPN